MLSITPPSLSYHSTSSPHFSLFLLLHPVTALTAEPKFGGHAQCVMDPEKKRNPYLGFVYTSFQERATFVSHDDTTRLAKDAGDSVLARICGTISSDEKHHDTGSSDVQRTRSIAFDHFAAVVQRLGVYTTDDYTVLEYLI
ncbi:hypothetical protein R6Q59_014346 [Mikania micrantha]